MDITPRLSENLQRIERYGEGGFTISATRYSGSLIVTPAQVIAWPVLRVHSITPSDMQPLIDIAGQIDMVLIGTGAQMAMILPDTVQHLKAHGIRVDAMDTGAACRTYNVLMSEDRKVAAALIAV